uniref:Uncharacterized protein n=1 Tax=Mesocestoides corti TaxID=53468 RepID=A0A5K3FR89_MESCO
MSQVPRRTPTGPISPWKQPRLSTAKFCCPVVSLVFINRGTLRHLVLDRAAAPISLIRLVLNAISCDTCLR